MGTDALKHVVLVEVMTWIAIYVKISRSQSASIYATFLFDVDMNVLLCAMSVKVDGFICRADNPCRKTLLCGCKCRQRCSESCKCDGKDRGRELFSRVNDKYCPLQTSDAARLMLLRVSSTNRDDWRTKCKPHGTTHCNEPCQEKIRCGHRCIGLCGEPCIHLCRFCDREKVLVIFPEYTVDTDPCYIQMIPCGHIVEHQSLLKDFNESGMCIQVRPMTCPTCKQPAYNSRFKHFFSSWISDVKAIEAITSQTRQDSKETDPAWVTKVEKTEELLKVHNSDLLSVAMMYDIERQSNFIQEDVCRVVRKGIERQKSSSCRLSTQAATDITLELFRLKALCRVLESS